MRFVNKTILLIIFLCWTNLSYAQEKDKLFKKAKKIKYDTTKIIDLSDKLGIYINTISKQNDIKFKDLNTGKKIKLQPNGQTNLGVGFNYKWLKLGVAFGLPLLNKDNEKYGETKRLDLQLNVFMRSLGIDTYIQNYKGFYLSNSGDYVDSVFSKLPNLSNMETFSMGLSAYYFFNSKRFSYQAVYVRNQIQKKSAGAFILGGFFNKNYTYSPNGFVPDELPDSIKDNYPLRGFETNVYGISIGYTYTLVVLKRLFINASFVPGVGLRFSEILRTDRTEVLNPVISGSTTLRFSLGYEGKYLYAGIKAITSVDTYNYNTIDISSSTGNLRFYVGKRFDFTLRKKKRSTPKCGDSF